jgi:hypothetical protein
VLYVILIFVEHSENPSKVLDLHEIQSFAEQWEKMDGGGAEEIYSSQEQNSRDVLGLQMPLSPRAAASKLMEAIASRINSP